jgi:dipeptidyl aminopeptidase/acylaminoacyl peptidase
MMGGSFGGYLSLLAAVRDSALIRCAVSVAGVSDLSELRNDSNFFVNSLVMKDLIGSDPVRLKAQSPRFHAAEIAVPVLLIHGAEDYTAEPDQSEFMARAMAAANKPYKMVMMPDTDHYFTTQAQQRQLFTEITDFVRPLLTAAPATQSASSN